MGCHSEATYLMLQSVLQCLIRRRDDNAARHLSWLLESEARRRGCDVSRYSVYFCYAKNYPTEVMAMRNILSEQALSRPELETVSIYLFEKCGYLTVLVIRDLQWESWKHLSWCFLPIYSKSSSILLLVESINNSFRCF